MRSPTLNEPTTGLLSGRKNTSHQYDGGEISGGDVKNMGRGFQGCFWCCFSISPLIMYGIYKIILSGDSANDMALLETKMPECASFINVMVNFYLGMAIYGFVFCFLGCIHPLMMVVGMLLLFIGLTFPGVWACMGISRCGG